MIERKVAYILDCEHSRDPQGGGASTEKEEGFDQRVEKVKWRERRMGRETVTGEVE